MKQPDKKLVLENGLEFAGYGFGADRNCVCELVFNTSVVGYQEILSDPSYTDKIIVMTYPPIGNYGITDEDFETRILQTGGLVVRDYCDTPSNFRYTKTVSELMEEQNIPGIYGVDTRMLTRIIREEGSQRAAIVSVEMSAEEAQKLIAETPANSELVRKVSCRKRWYSRTPNHRFDVVVVDCGVKQHVITALNRRGCNVVIVPFDTPAEVIESLNPHGLLIAGGPGAPQDVPQVIELISQLRGRMPMMGISLGHQLIALSYGAKVEKDLKGNHVGSYPIRNLCTNHIETSGMSHMFKLDEESLKNTPLEPTHVNVLDGAVVGTECRRDKVFSVEFHPEGAPGARDCAYLFDKFIKLMEENQYA